MAEEFSEELKRAIEENFVVINETDHVAFVGANITEYPSDAYKILAMMKRIMGLRAELQRHGYIVP